MSKARTPCSRRWVPAPPPAHPSTRAPTASGTAASRFLRRRPSLKERELLHVAELALELEREQSRPVDLEFAFSDGELHLLQCRPITTATLASGQDRGGAE